MTPRNQPAGPRAELKVEWMANQAVFLSEPRQEARLYLFRFSFAWSANAHA
jgi:hypothetical protein